MLGLCIELTFFMLLTSMAGSVGATLAPLSLQQFITKLFLNKFKCFRVFFKWVLNCYKYKRHYVATPTSRRWEMEYNLSELPEYFLAYQYLELSNVML